MRILHFIDSLGIGGKERQVVELLKGLSKRREVELLVVCMDHDDFYKWKLDKLMIPLKYCVRKIRYDPFVFIKFCRIVKCFNPHIIHTNCYMASFYALPIVRFLGIKLINGSIRNAFSSGGIRWKLEKMLLRYSDFRVANSKAGLLSRGFSTESKKNIVIHNGFDFSRVKNLNVTSLTNCLPEINGKKVVGMVAEFSKYKDYRSFLLAALDILKKRDDVIFLTVGDGETIEACRKMVPKYCDKIAFLGKRKDVEEIISIFDIGVLSTYTEGISNSIMEYMAFGKPVIVTGGGGSNEIVIDGHTGFLAPPEDPKILSEKIETLLNNPAVAIKMGQVGKKLLEEKYSLDSLIENILRVYRLALKQTLTQ